MQVRKQHSRRKSQQTGVVWPHVCRDLLRKESGELRAHLRELPVLRDPLEILQTRRDDVAPLMGHDALLPLSPGSIGVAIGLDVVADLLPVTRGFCAGEQGAEK